MRARRLVAVLVFTAFPALASAGTRALFPVPVLGESGLLALGAALGVAGILVMRRRKR